jgi:DNA-binding MarR family transcriptional regulator
LIDWKEVIDVDGYVERIYVLVHHGHEQLLKLSHDSKPGNGFTVFGINLKQGIILKILLEDDGITQRELTRRLQITSSSCGELLVKLEKCGSLRRRANPSDGRTFNVYLTEQGRALGERYREQSRAMLEEWGENLTPKEKARLFALLTKLSAGLDAQIEKRREV